jgi:hypothetical protein
MVVPPADISLPTIEDSMFSRKSDKLPAIEKEVTSTNAATPRFTSKIPGEWSLIPPGVTA